MEYLTDYINHVETECPKLAVNSETNVPSTHCSNSCRNRNKLVPIFVYVHQLSSVYSNQNSQVFAWQKIVIRKSQFSRMYTNCPVCTAIRTLNFLHCKPIIKFDLFWSYRYHISWRWSITFVVRHCDVLGLFPLYQIELHCPIKENLYPEYFSSKREDSVVSSQKGDYYHLLGNIKFRSLDFLFQKVFYWKL